MKIFRLKCLLLTLILIMSFSFPVYAQSEIMDQNLMKSSKTTFNEYEVLKNLNKEYTKAKADNALKTSKFSDYSEDDIFEIENYKEEYSKKIYELKEWEVEKLEAVGYNETQIEAIKTFDGSEEKMMLAATTVKVSAGFRNLVQNSTGTTHDKRMNHNLNDKLGYMVF